MEKFVQRAITAAPRLLFWLILLLARAGFYLLSLVAVHTSLAILARLAGLWPGGFQSRGGATSLSVTIAAGVIWMFGIATLMGVLTRSPEAFWVTVVLSFPLAGIVAWQLHRWLVANSWAEQPGSLMLGTIRTAPFSVARPYTVTVAERLKHMAVAGATGSGKTVLVSNLALQDARRGQGFCLIDPKDTLIDTVLPHIPANREADVILIDPTGDPETPVGLNPLHDVPEERRSIAAAEILAIFHRYFGPSAWGPRLENILRNVLLLLLATPGSTLLDIPRVLLDADWRMAQLAACDPAVRQFFLVEYEHLLQRGDALAPVLNKIGLLASSPVLRNLLGQSTSSFSVRTAMDTGKILLVRIPQGALGAEVSSFLGALVVAMLQLAAHSRVDLPPERRRPFFLYVDEFQTFATSSFERILTEVRSFGMGLVCLSQYPEQLSHEIQLAISHNAATTVHCVYEHGHHLLQVTRLEHAGRDVPPLILTPPPPLPPGDPQRAAHIRALSRARYGRPRTDVEPEILSALGGSQPGGPATGRKPRSRRKRQDVDEE